MPPSQEEIDNKFKPPTPTNTPPADTQTTVPEAPAQPRPAPTPATPDTPPKQATPPGTTSNAPQQQQPNPQPQQPNEQQPVEPKPDQSAQIPDRIDPELLNTMPSLSSIYNSDGTRKTPPQQAAERTAQDIVDLPKALADNQTGLTPLGGGGKVEKTITATTDGWQVNQTVTLANGYTSTTSSKPGIDVEELDNGRTATTLSYQDAATQARTELGRTTQQMLTPGQVQPDNPAQTPSSVFGTGIKDAGDADQLVEAIERLTANSNAPTRVVKDKDGRIISLSVLGADGKDHVMVLNAGGISYDQNNTTLFEFYRGLDGKITTPDGHPIINVEGHNIRVDDRGVPVLPDNPFAETAGVVSSNGVRTNRPHGAHLAPNLADLPPGTTGDPSPTPSTTTPYNGPLRSPVTPAADGLYYVELPSGDLSAIGAINNTDLAAIEEIRVPPGVTADRMYKVQGGGLLIEDTTGIHWATDPGNIRTGEQIGNDITKTVANELIWAVAGEGLGYVAVRAGAKILPKIAPKLDDAAGKAGTAAATKPGQILDDTAPLATSRAADETIPSGSGKATNDVTPAVNSPVSPTVEPKHVTNLPAATSLVNEATIVSEGSPLNPTVHFDQLGGRSPRPAAAASSSNRPIPPTTPINSSALYIEFPTGAEAVSAGNANQRLFNRLFPELTEINPLHSTRQWEFLNNCQSCVVATDQRLAGNIVTALGRPNPFQGLRDFNWPHDVLNAVGNGNKFQQVGGYDEIEQQLLKAGPGARAIVHGMRLDKAGFPVPGHVFNVVNRNGKIYYIDGQLNGWAHLDHYSGGLELLRTN